ncbi:hypothetical protein ABFX02_14G070900 [Erythranthe guttata]
MVILFQQLAVLFNIFESAQFKPGISTFKCVLKPQLNPNLNFYAIRLWKIYFWNIQPRWGLSPDCRHSWWCLAVAVGRRSNMAFSIGK